MLEMQVFAVIAKRWCSYTKLTSTIRWTFLYTHCKSSIHLFIEVGSRALKVASIFLQPTFRYNTHDLEAPYLQFDTVSLFVSSHLVSDKMNSRWQPCEKTNH